MSAVAAATCANKGYHSPVNPNGRPLNVVLWAAMSFLSLLSLSPFECIRL